MMGNFDRYRSLEDLKFTFVKKMPKVFLMSGKRKNMDIQHLCKEESELSSDEPGSPGRVTPRSETQEIHCQSSSGRCETSPCRDSHFNFSSSPESAFSKICKLSEQTTGSPNINMAATSTSHPAHMPGLFPGLYPAMFPYPYASLSAFSAGNLAQSSAGISTSPGILSPPSDKTDEKVVAEESHDRSMFYYVDPRIPFTNYFLNLTRLLQNSASSANNLSNKEQTATTPIGRIGGEASRAEIKETPMTPDSTKPSPEKRKSRDDSPSPTSSFYSEASDAITKNELKVDVMTSKIGAPSVPEPRFPNPFSANLLQPHHNASMVPLPGGGIFHPAMMSLPGHGYRRFNPEKPPPVKKYKCDVCGKAFSRSNTLVTHKRIHTGDKPFKCEICNRAFRQPGNLTRHRLTHTTVKPYVCPSCNKAFNRASNLHTHMRTHTSFKAYVCPYCGKGFHQKIDMKIHCYTHTAHTARDLPQLALN